MRKHAPVLIFTTLIAFASGSALALGDRAKDKKDSQTASQPAGSSSTATTPSGATTNKDTRCDESKYPNKAAMPADCVDKTSGGTGSSGASGTSGAGSSGAGSSGSGSSGSGASSGSSGK